MELSHLSLLCVFWRKQSLFSGGGLASGVGVKGRPKGRVNRARAWLPKANLVQYEVVRTLLIQAKDLVAALAASQGDISASAEKP